MTRHMFANAFENIAVNKAFAVNLPKSGSVGEDGGSAGRGGSSGGGSVVTAMLQSDVACRLLQ